MHAFLLINHGSDVKSQIGKLANGLHSKIMDFPLIKIDDVRNLNNLIRLSFKEPTLIVCQNIHEAGEEALNAFLKNLEEPQDNIYFVLTAPSVQKVLPTIVSRCQIVKTAKSKSQIINGEKVEEFLSMTTGQRLAFFDKIKGRPEAIEFVENLIFYLHENKEFKNMEILIKTLTRLKANGNVNLQLSNLAISYLI